MSTERPSTRRKRKPSAPEPAFHSKVENSGLLLIAAEEGQVALVLADPNGFTEVASIKGAAFKTRERFDCHNYSSSPYQPPLRAWLRKLSIDRAHGGP